jgi:hypothetical protein
METVTARPDASHLAPLDLHGLLTPLPVACFFADAWTSRAVHIPGPPQKFAGLFGWAALNDLLNRGAFDWPRLRLVRAGQVVDQSEAVRTGTQIDPTKVIRLCQAGATLILNAIHRDCPALHRLSQALRAQLGEPTPINLYCSWPGQPGLPRHFDSHEAFILQVEGRKRWRVFEPTDAAPIACRPDQARPTEAPYLETVLSKGDVLYIPRGHWHDAIAEGEPSLHLTLAVVCRTGLSFSAWLGERLQKESAWRQNLPLAFGDGTWRDEHSSITAHLAALAEHLATVVRDPATVRQYLAECVSRDTSRCRYQLPAQVQSESVVDLDMPLTLPAASDQLKLIALPDGGGQLITWGRRLHFTSALSRVV